MCQKQLMMELINCNWLYIFFFIHSDQERIKVSETVPGGPDGDNSQPVLKFIELIPLPILVGLVVTSMVLF